MHTLREDADENARHDAFDRRADDDADDLIADFRGEPGGQAVENPQDAAQHGRECQFFHAFPPMDLLRIPRSSL